jgi:hypothetical protein
VPRGDFVSFVAAANAVAIAPPVNTSVIVESTVYDMLSVLTAAAAAAPVATLAAAYKI